MTEAEINLQAEYLCIAILKLAPPNTSISKWIEELAARGEHESAHITSVADSLLWNVRCHQNKVEGFFRSNLVQ